MSKKYKLGVVGNPIEHSLSPFIHSRFARNEGINLEYLPYKVSESDFVNFIKVLSVINKRKDVFSSILNSDLDLKDSEMELIDKSILFYGIYELENKDENNVVKEPRTVSLKSYYDGKKESNFSKDKIIVLNAYGEIIDGSFQDLSLIHI